MKAKDYYFLALLFGTIIPLAEFLPWYLDNGPDLARFSQELEATAVTRFFKWDVILSYMALVVFVVAESRRHSLRYAWVSLVFGAVVGVSCGLPLFLYLRELALEQGITRPARRFAWPRARRRLRVG